MTRHSGYGVKADILTRTKYCENVCAELRSAMAFAPAKARLNPPSFSDMKLLKITPGKPGDAPAHLAPYGNEIFWLEGLPFLACIMALVNQANEVRNATFVIRFEAGEHQKMEAVTKSLKGKADAPTKLWLMGLMMKDAETPPGAHVTPIMACHLAIHGQGEHDCGEECALVFATHDGELMPSYLPLANSGIIIKPHGC